MSFPINASDWLRTPDGQRLLNGGSFGLQRAYAGFKLIRQALLPMAQVSREVVPGTHCVLYAGATAGVSYVAGANGIPAIRLYYRPGWPSADLPSHFLSTGRSFGKIGNLITHFYAEALAQLVSGGRMRELRKSLGYRRPGSVIARNVIVDAARFDPHPSVFAIPRAFATPRLARDEKAVITGFIWSHAFMDGAADDASALEAVSRMRHSGHPVAYVGFGSVGHTDRILGQIGTALAAESVGVVCDAAAYPRLRGIDGLRVAPITRVRHDYLFSMCDLVVHHGGSGTVAASLRARVPMLLFPRWFDQFFWSARCTAMGLAVPVDYEHPTSRALRNSIRKALEMACSSQYARQCELVDLSDGAERITDLVEHYVND